VLARIDRSWMWGVLWLHAGLKSAAVRLTRLAVRSPVALRPMHRLQTDPKLHSYQQHLTAGMSVLHVGCGHGMPTVRVAGRTSTVIALRRGPTAPQMADYLLPMCAPANLSLLATDAELALPLRSDYFDAALLLDVMEHLHERQAHLAEVRRLLHEPCALLGSEPSRDTSCKGRSGTQVSQLRPMPITRPNAPRAICPSNWSAPAFGSRAASLLSSSTRHGPETLTWLAWSARQHIIGCRGAGTVLPHSLPVRPQHGRCDAGRRPRL
jgi:SAM-dependent methyltransferase